VGTAGIGLATSRHVVVCFLFVCSSRTKKPGREGGSTGSVTPLGLEKLTDFARPLYAASRHYVKRNTASSCSEHLSQM
jgi:hypothetical protein